MGFSWLVFGVWCDFEVADFLTGLQDLQDDIRWMVRKSSSRAGTESTI
jgi:hypothetical protein